MRTPLTIYATLALMLAISPHAAAQATVSLTNSAPALTAFIATYVSVVNSHDTNAYERLIHPKYLACKGDKTEPFYRYWLKSEFEYQIPADCTIQTQSVTNWMGGGGLADMFDFPVPPTHTLGFSFHDKKMSRAWLRYMVCDTNGVFLAVPCPKPSTVEYYRKLETAH